MYYSGIAPKKGTLGVAFCDQSTKQASFHIFPQNPILSENMVI